MQRTGRKGHAQFRVVVQDSRRTPTSGKVVAALGHYNPHTKQTSLDKEKATHFLNHGAQPSDRVVRLLKSEGVKLPSWVKEPTVKDRVLRNTDKLRRNRPPEEKASVETPEPEVPVAEAETPAPTEDDKEITESSEAVDETVSDAVDVEQPTEEIAPSIDTKTTPQEATGVEPGAEEKPADAEEPVEEKSDDK